MIGDTRGEALVEARVARVFAMVCEALAAATEALLSGRQEIGRAVVEADALIDELTASAEQLVWEQIDSGLLNPSELRRSIGLLIIVLELERSADLAEHIAQRALTNLGSQMSPVSRGIVQRMSEVAIEMWKTVSDGYAGPSVDGHLLDEADEELDILRNRLTSEVAESEMGASVAAQVALLGRFYERIGDHSVNLARRLQGLPERSD